MASFSVVTLRHFPMTQPWAFAPVFERQDRSLNLSLRTISLCVRVSVVQIRAAAFAHSTLTSDVTSTGNGFMSRKATKPISVLATALTSGVQTTTTTW